MQQLSYVVLGVNITFVKTVPYNIIASLSDVMYVTNRLMVSSIQPKVFGPYFIFNWRKWGVTGLSFMTFFMSVKRMLQSLSEPVRELHSWCPNGVRHVDMNQLYVNKYIYSK